MAQVRQISLSNRRTPKSRSRWLHVRSLITTACVFTNFYRTEYLTTTTTKQQQTFIASEYFFFHGSKVLCFCSLISIICRTKKTLPETERVADDLRCNVRETLSAHTAPDSALKNFHTSLSGCRASYQSHCKTITLCCVGMSYCFGRIQNWVESCMYRNSTLRLHGIFSFGGNFHHHHHNHPHHHLTWKHMTFSNAVDLAPPVKLCTIVYLFFIRMATYVTSVLFRDLLDYKITIIVQYCHKSIVHL